MTTTIIKKMVAGMIYISMSMIWIFISMQKCMCYLGNAMRVAENNGVYSINAINDGGFSFTPIKDYRSYMNWNGLNASIIFGIIMLVLITGLWLIIDRYLLTDDK